ncbi:MAG TPA: phospholipid carrier-dependent glycosyltransferase, partial [Spirochaetota bacterium]
MLKKHFILILSFAVIFVASLAVYTRNNSFPYYYHTTEPSKIEQVVNHHYNFNHPLLMLNTVSAVSFFSKPKSSQEMVETGRWVSAVYASLTLLLLMGCAYMVMGTPGAVMAGVFMAFNTKMIALSHYFKEDPTFLFGISLTLLLFSVFFRKPNLKMLIAVAIASAVASSGKYVGFIFLPIGIYIAAT